MIKECSREILESSCLHLRNVRFEFGKQTVISTFSESSVLSSDHIVNNLRLNKYIYN